MLYSLSFGEGIEGGVRGIMKSCTMRVPPVI
jgi:hypothetical protein